MPGCPNCSSPQEEGTGVCSGCREPTDERARQFQDTLIGALGPRYELVRRLGAGAFGEVFRAWDSSLRRDVAVKRRTLREAKMSAKLIHPHIVTVHDIAQTATSTLIVMEYVQGGTLHALLRKESRLPWDESVHQIEVSTVCRLFQSDSAFL